MIGIARALLTILTVLLVGCSTSGITTENSEIATIYIASPAEVMSALSKTVNGMKNYGLKQQGENEVIVTYHPKGFLMGKANIQVIVKAASGLKADGTKLSGAELIYTDVTPPLLGDTTFHASDIIDRIQTALDQFMQFKGIKSYSVQRA